MTTTHGTAEFACTAEPSSCVPRLFKERRSAVQERRKRARVRATPYGLGERGLKDIGIAWSEIEYMASNAVGEGHDPRRRRSSGSPLPLAALLRGSPPPPGYCRRP
jgi:hypothetical protein